MMRPFGEKGAESPADLEWPETAEKETGVCTVVGGGCSECFHVWAGACVVSISHWCQRRGHPGFQIHLPKCGAEGKKRDVRLTSCQQPNIKQ